MDVISHWLQVQVRSGHVRSLLSASLTCVNVDILVAPLCSAAKDKNFLRVAVRDGCNFAVGEFGSQVYRDRSPPAPKVYDGHAVYYA